MSWGHFGIEPATLRLPDDSFAPITNRVLILGGDFNVSFEGRGDFSLGHLKKVISQFNLIDTF